MSLHYFLDQLQAHYDDPKYLGSDPLEFVHRYSDPWDQEAVAILAAVLAYGNVRQIRKSISNALQAMEAAGFSPATFVRQSERAKKTDFFKSWVHRFNRGPDLVELFRLMSLSWKKYGSVGAHFLHYLDPSAPTFEVALNSLIRDWRAWSETSESSSFQYLLTAPEQGSCCKRWCMLLRWMGRLDALDPGLWTKKSGLAHTFPHGRALRADQLILPLDTHTGRISQYLGLTHRRTLGWKAANEITIALKKCNPADPTRYDFALSRLGILDLCQKKFKVEICQRCELLPVCHYANSKRPKLAKSH